AYCGLEHFEGHRSLKGGVGRLVHVTVAALANLLNDVVLLESAEGCLNGVRPREDRTRFGRRKALQPVEELPGFVVERCGSVERHRQKEWMVSRRKRVERPATLIARHDVRLEKQRPLLFQRAGKELLQLLPRDLTVHQAYPFRTQSQAPWLLACIPS